MGLDTTHDAWHGGYGAFNRFRNEIARAAGYQVSKIVYPDGWTADIPLIDWGHLPEGAVYGDWGREVPSDALHYLFVHSDCEGHLKPKACRALAERLDELLPKIAQLPADPGHIGQWAQKTRQFIDGLRNAADSNQRLGFY